MEPMSRLHRHIVEEGGKEDGVGEEYEGEKRRRGEEEVWGGGAETGGEVGRRGVTFEHVGPQR